MQHARRRTRVRRRRTIAAVVVVAVAAGAALAAWQAGADAPSNRALADTGRTMAQRPHVPTATTAPPLTTTTVPAPTTTQPPPGPPYAVSDATLTLVDASRPTPARGSVPSIPSRTMRTVIRRPVGLTGPLPLVVFAHGWNVEPETYEPLLDAWAAAGYLVAAPECPGSAAELPGTPVQDYAAQARDLSFVVSSLLDGRAGPVNRKEIVVAGHSDGGTAVTILALNPAYADPRIKAYVNMAGQIPPDVPGPWGTSPVPGALLVAVGDEDQYNNLTLSTQAYDAAHMPKALLTVPGGDHLGTFVAATPTAAAVRAATVRFLGTVFATSGTSFSGAQLAAALQGSANQPFVVTSSG